jgi:hypothetical protein
MVKTNLRRRRILLIPLRLKNRRLLTTLLDAVADEQMLGPQTPPCAACPSHHVQLDAFQAKRDEQRSDDVSDWL